MIVKFSIGGLILDHIIKIKIYQKVPKSRWSRLTIRNGLWFCVRMFFFSWLFAYHNSSNLKFDFVSAHKRTTRFDPINKLRMPPNESPDFNIAVLITIPELKSHRIMLSSSIFYTREGGFASALLWDSLQAVFNEESCPGKKKGLYIFIIGAIWKEEGLLSVNSDNF